MRGTRQTITFIAIARFAFEIFLLARAFGTNNEFGIGEDILKYGYIKFPRLIFVSRLVAVDPFVGVNDNTASLRGSRAW